MLWKNFPRSFGTLLMFILALPFAAIAQVASDAPGAPVPPQVTSAKRVFISNAGEDSAARDLFGHAQDFPYNQLYAAMKSWKRVEIVNSPATADVILEIRFSVSGSSGEVFKGDTVGPLYDALLELQIIDPGTRVSLWGFVRHVPVAKLKSNREKDSMQAVSALIDEAKNVMSLAPSGAGK